MFDRFRDRGSLCADIRTPNYIVKERDCDDVQLVHVVMNG